MSKQMILIKGVSIQQFDYIKDLVEQGLNEGKDRFCVFTPTIEAEIEVIELPDTDEKPMTIHNTHMGMQPTELRAVVYQVVMEVFKELVKEMKRDE